MVSPILKYYRASAKLVKWWWQRTIKGHGKTSLDVLKLAVHPKTTWTTCEKKDRSCEGSSTSEVLCFCNDNREAGEMVQCEMCAEWFHLECSRMKESVGVLNGRACGPSIASVCLQKCRR